MKVSMVVAVITALAAVSSASAQPDPRVCPPKTPAAVTTKSCAYDAAVNAFKKTMGAHMQQGGFDADISCRAASPSMLVWRCSWKGGPIVGYGVLRFNRVTFKPTLTVVENVCTQPITGDIVWHGCTKILPPPPH